ncbi:MAG: HAMP domain-containing histidine kinase [Nannocystaceae bacterium]|nr:HAMP domain-containing histidine kinase [Nannocystaceae bacterium]
MHLAERPRSFASQLTWTLTLGASTVAALALVTMVLLADMLVRRHVEHAATMAAAVLAAELDENPALVAEIEEEATELGIDGHVAVLHGGEPRSGDQRLRAPSEESCGFVELEREPELVCVRPATFDPALVVAVGVPAERALSHRTPLLVAASIVLGLVLAGSLWVGATQSRRLIGPLSRLQRAVARIDSRAPFAAQLPATAAVEEIDAVRGAIAELLGRLEVELTRTRRFAADAAHELRTPLAKLSADVELAREHEGLDLETGESLERLSRTTAHLISLTERLLLLATPAEAMGSSEGTSMAAVACGMLERRNAVDRARLSILVDDDDDGLVRGDPVLLSAMLDNAVDNALKYSTGAVTVHVRTEGRFVDVEIVDDGPGVPLAEQAWLFEPFRRGEAARHRPGHGLGLALVAHIASAHGGKAAFDEHHGHGARLVITLPLTAPTCG